MSKKKKKEFKSFPIVLPRPPKSKKLAAEFAKKNPKKEEIEIDSFAEKRKNVIKPLLEQLEDGTYVSSHSKEKFEDLFQLLVNLK